MTTLLHAIPWHTTILACAGLLTSRRYCNDMTASCLHPSSLGIIGINDDIFTVTRSGFTSIPILSCHGSYPSPYWVVRACIHPHTELSGLVSTPILNCQGLYPPHIELSGFVSTPILNCQGLYPPNIELSGFVSTPILNCQGLYPPPYWVVRASIHPHTELLGLVSIPILSE